MKKERHVHLDRLLDLLAEEVAERLQVESHLEDASPDHDRLPSEAAGGPKPPPSPVEPPQPAPPPEPEPEMEAQTKSLERDLETGFETPIAPPVAHHTAQLLGRLALLLFALVIVINIPINRHGTTLATAMPDARALIVRDGLVVKEEDDPEFYVYEDGEFRWISSLEAFERHGYQWEDVHVVKDGFLEPYQIGPPIHVILKCRDSPHIYRLEGGKKRWIVDIEAFEAEGHLWEDVQFVSCSSLRGLPDGETVPPGHGPAPGP